MSGRGCHHQPGADRHRLSGLGAGGAAPGRRAKGCIAVIATIPVGSGPGGVAVARKTGTIYVANDFSNTVSVINGRTRTVTAAVPVGDGPEAVVVDPRTHTIYVTNNGSAGSPARTVSVINGRANTVTATVTVGRDPVGVAAYPRARTGYVADKGDGTVSVLGPCP